MLEVCDSWGWTEGVVGCLLRQRPETNVEPTVDDIVDLFLTLYGDEVPPRVGDKFTSEEVHAARLSNDAHISVSGKWASKMADYLDVVVAQKRLEAILIKTHALIMRLPLTRKSIEWFWDKANTWDIAYKLYLRFGREYLAAYVSSTASCDRLEVVWDLAEQVCQEGHKKVGELIMLCIVLNCVRCDEWCVSDGPAVHLRVTQESLSRHSAIDQLLANYLAKCSTPSGGCTLESGVFDKAMWSLLHDDSADLTILLWLKGQQEERVRESILETFSTTCLRNSKAELLLAVCVACVCASVSGVNGHSVAVLSDSFNKHIEDGLLLRTSSYNPLIRLLGTTVAEAYFSSRIHGLRSLSDALRDRRQSAPPSADGLEDCDFSVLGGLDDCREGPIFAETWKVCQVSGLEGIHFNLSDIDRFQDPASFDEKSLEYRGLVALLAASAGVSGGAQLRLMPCCHSGDKVSAAETPRQESRPTSQNEGETRSGEMEPSGDAVSLPVTEMDPNWTDDEWSVVKRASSEMRSQLRPCVSLWRCLERLRGNIMPAEINPTGASLELLSFLQTPNTRIKLDYEPAVKIWEQLTVLQCDLRYHLESALFAVLIPFAEIAWSRSGSSTLWQWYRVAKQTVGGFIMLGYDLFETLLHITAPENVPVDKWTTSVEGVLCRLILCLWISGALVKTGSISFSEAHDLSILDSAVLVRFVQTRRPDEKKRVHPWEALVDGIRQALYSTTSGNLRKQLTLAAAMQQALLFVARAAPMDTLESEWCAGKTTAFLPDKLGVKLLHQGGIICLTETLGAIEKYLGTIRAKVNSNDLLAAELYVGPIAVLSRVAAIFLVLEVNNIEGFEAALKMAAGVTMSFLDTKISGSSRALIEGSHVNLISGILEAWAMSRIHPLLTDTEVLRLRKACLHCQSYSREHHSTAIANCEQFIRLTRV